MKYFYRFKEMDGDWSEWRECSAATYTLYQGRWDVDTWCQP